MNRLIGMYEFDSPMKTSPSSIGIFIVLNNNTVNEYSQHIASLKCYAYKHTYQFIVIHQKQYPACTNMTKSTNFQKHCSVRMYLLENANIEWLLVLDMDVLVLNMSKKIESYLPISTTQSSIHMILYERFNGEIMAENYIVNNHPWSHRFLLRWIEFERYTMHFKFHNADYGALHILLLDSTVGDVSQSEYNRCFRIYEKLTSPALFHTYIGCCKCALGGRWEFNHLRILRRGHSFVRDNFGSDMKQRIWPPTDFLVHGPNMKVDVYYWKTIDTHECTHWNWVFPIRKDAIMTNFTEVKETMQRFDKSAAEGYPQSIGLPDISDCWPNCIDTEIRRKAFMEKVCHQNASWRSF